MENELCPGAEIASGQAFDPADGSRRTFLCAAGMLMAGLLLPHVRAERSSSSGSGSGHKLLLIIVGGVRRAETFSPQIGRAHV